MSGSGSSRDRDGKKRNDDDRKGNKRSGDNFYGGTFPYSGNDPYLQPAGRVNHNAFLDQQSSYGDTHQAKKTDYSKKRYEDRKAREALRAPRAPTAKEVADEDAAGAVAERYRREDEAKEARKPEWRRRRPKLSDQTGQEEGAGRRREGGNGTEKGSTGGQRRRRGHGSGEPDLEEALRKAFEED